MFLCWWCSNLSGNFLISFPPLWFWNSLSDQFRAGRKVCVPGADNVLCLCRMERIAVNIYFVISRIFLCPRDRATNWQLAKIESPKNNPPPNRSVTKIHWSPRDHLGFFGSIWGHFRPFFWSFLVTKSHHRSSLSHPGSSWKKSSSLDSQRFSWNGVEFWTDFYPIFGKGQQLWECLLQPGWLTRMTQYPNVSIAHIQEIVLGF